MPTIRIARNPNFKRFWTITNSREQTQEEVEGRTLAIKTAMRMARGIGERKFLHESDEGWVAVTV